MSPWTRSESFRKAHQVNFAGEREYPLGDEKAGRTPKEWFITPTKLETVSFAWATCFLPEGFSLEKLRLADYASRRFIKEA